MISKAYLAVFVWLSYTAVLCRGQVCSQSLSPREIRGAWVASVANIDWPKSIDRSTTENKADLIALLDSLQQTGINVVIFQVRPSGDALYASTIEPWSRYLTGTEGKAPNPFWDPLEFIIQEAHQRNMELHAWINPYRANMSPTVQGLASNNMAVEYADSSYIYGKYVWMDPGRLPVQTRTRNVVKDIVTRYDVDAIHMDDYFYPYPVDGEDFPDAGTYQTYINNGGTYSRNEWRRNNVNTLVQLMANDIKAVKPYVKFGISPFGIWKPGYPSQIKGFSSYDSLYADSRLWLQNGWVDYLAPQLYWQIDPPAQSFTALADWWTDGLQNPLARHVYPGLASYRLEVSNWPANEIVRQIQESRNRRSRQCWGGIHFSARHIRDNTSGLTTALRQRDIYLFPALVPTMSWLSQSAVAQPVKPIASASGAVISWINSDKTSVRSWALYEWRNGSCQLQNVYPANVTVVPLPMGQYVVAAVDRLGREVLSDVLTLNELIIG